MPVVAILLPLYLFYSSLHLIDTYIALITANLVANIPLSVWLLQGFFDEVPIELDEVARVEGASLFNILWQIMLPIVKPAIAVTAIFVFLFTWNEFFIAVVLTRSQAIPITVAFSSFKQKHTFYWGPMSAALLVSLAPLLTMVILLQKHIVRGLTLGAVKG